MVSKDHDLSVRRQCGLLLLARSNLYYQPKGESVENLRFMVIIDKKFLDTPWYGSRHPLGDASIACRAVNGALYAASGPQMWPPQGSSIDASDAFGANLPDAEHEQETPPAQDLSISASEIDN